MNKVNADSQYLLFLIKQMQDTLTRVDQTNNLITKKYQQLGDNWNDKKYLELGNVVIECNDALNSLKVILSEGIKYINALTKNLQEYENINLNTSTAINSAEVNSTSVLNKYVDALKARYGNAESNVKQVFEKFSSDLKIIDSKYPSDQVNHYNPYQNDPEHPRGVYYNSQADSSNPCGIGTSYYHELAHMIDHAATGFQGMNSNSSEFADALMQDSQNILSEYNNLTTEQQASFNQRLYQSSAHSLSDLLDATTDGQLHGGYTHSRSYWQRSGNLQAEAFAHFFEASMGDRGKLELLSNFFPTAFAVFTNIINHML